MQVGVHHDDGLAARVVHAGGDGDLMAEIAAQLEKSIPRVHAGLGLANDRARIARAVVDENRLGRPVERVQQRVKAAQQQRQHSLLVVDGNDEGIDGRHARDVRKGRRGR